MTDPEQNELLDEEKGLEHIDNLGTIRKLEALGFEGPDASLDISLFEYGYAWLKTEDGVLYVYGIHQIKNEEYGQMEWDRFDRCTLDPEDFQSDFDWADFNRMAEAIFAYDRHGEHEIHRTPTQCLEMWMKLPYTARMQDIFSRNDRRDVFGESYWEGFKIKDNMEHVTSGQSEFPCPVDGCDGCLLEEELRPVYNTFTLRGWNLVRGDEVFHTEDELTIHNKSLMCSKCRRRFSANQHQRPLIHDIGDVLEMIYDGEITGYKYTEE